MPSSHYRIVALTSPWLTNSPWSEADQRSLLWTMNSVCVNRSKTGSSCSSQNVLPAAAGYVAGWISGTRNELQPLRADAPLLSPSLLCCHPLWLSEPILIWHLCTKQTQWQLLSLSEYMQTSCSVFVTVSSLLCISVKIILVFHASSLSFLGENSTLKPWIAWITNFPRHISHLVVFDPLSLLCRVAEALANIVCLPPR